MKYNKNILLICAITAVMLFSSCQKPGGNNPGSEYMPDMSHSIAYEANTYAYYYNNTWGSKDEYYESAQPRLPQKGTIARQGRNGANAGKASTYAYGNTEEERTRATNELINNPYPITDAGMKEVKELYDTYCGICHGEKGDGNGYLMRDGGAYPAQPANFLLPEFVSASNGRYYHAIMHGKNVMGSYSDKINEEERWNVIHYIRSLQAKELKLAYNQYENTLNSVDRPAGDMVVEAESHSHDHGHGEENHDHMHDANGHHDDHGHEATGHHDTGDHHEDDHDHGEDHKH